MQNIFIGIDVSKDKLDVAFPLGDSFECKCFSNDEKGWELLRSDLSEDLHCVMEVTGVYYLGLAHYLFKHGQKLSVVNPLRTKRFSQMKLMRTKTDKADAVMISKFGHSQRPDLWKPSSKVIQELRQLLSQKNLLNKIRTMLGNALHAQSQHPEPSKLCQQQLNKTLNSIEKSIDKLVTTAHQLITKNFDSEMKSLTSIPGIGIKTASLIITMTEAMGKFETAGKLVAYAGLCPKISQSGKSDRKSHPICKMGQSALRTTLYMCALTAKKYNPQCKSLYDRLLEKGKPKKKALIAVAHKILRQAFACCKYNQIFKPNIILNKKDNILAT